MTPKLDPKIAERKEGKVEKGLRERDREGTLNQPRSCRRQMEKT